MFAFDIARDVTNWSLLFTASRALGSTAKEIQQAAVITDTAGAFEVRLSAAQTDIRPGALYYDIWRVDSGAEELLGAGSMTLRDVVRTP